MHVDLLKHLRGSRCGLGRRDRCGVDFTPAQLPGRYPVQFGKHGLHGDWVRGRLRNRLAQVWRQQVVEPALCRRFRGALGRVVDGGLSSPDPVRQSRGIHRSPCVDFPHHQRGRHTIRRAIIPDRKLAIWSPRSSGCSSQHFAGRVGRSRIRIAFSPTQSVNKDD